MIPFLLLSCRLWRHGFEASQVGQIETLQTVMLMNSGSLSLPRGLISLGDSFMRPSLAFPGVLGGLRDGSRTDPEPTGPSAGAGPGEAGAQSLGTWRSYFGIVHPLPSGTGQQPSPWRVLMARPMGDLLLRPVSDALTRVLWGHPFTHTAPHVCRKNVASLVYSEWPAFQRGGLGSWV